MGMWFSRGVLVAILCLMSAFGTGYILFRMEIARLETNSADAHNPASGPANAPASSAGNSSLVAAKAGKSTGIVVLTGDVARIETGIRLLEKGFGSRVLVSGVNERTSRSALLRAVNYKPSATPCCIDIGHVARDTRGNAIETAHWARQHSYGDVLVVTSNYHMPRSLLELGHAMKDVRLVPIVAREKAPGRNSLQKGADKTPEASGVSRHRQAGLLRHSLKEYGKFLVAAARIWIERGFAADTQSRIAKSF